MRKLAAALLALALVAPAAPAHADSGQPIPQLHRQGRFPIDRLVRFYELKDIDEALEASHRGDVLKPVLTMPH